MDLHRLFIIAGCTGLFRACSPADRNNGAVRHAVGIDGPLLHFSDPDRRTLHVWLLSFERHALVGHVVIELI